MAPALASGIFVVVAVAGSSLLNSGVKAAVHRTRPASASRSSTSWVPASRAVTPQAAVVGFGVLLLVFLPVLGRLWRRIAVTMAAFMVLLIGFSRVALAAHFVSDVVAGFVLGAAWLAAVTAVFSAWKVMSGADPVHPTEGLAPDQANPIAPSSTPPGGPEDAHR